MRCTLHIAHSREKKTPEYAARERVSVLKTPDLHLILCSQRQPAHGE